MPIPEFEFLLIKLRQNFVIIPYKGNDKLNIEHKNESKITQNKMHKNVKFIKHPNIKKKKRKMGLF